MSCIRTLEKVKRKREEKMLNDVMQGGMSQIGQPIYYTFRGRSAIEAVRIMDGEPENKDGYLMRAIIRLILIIFFIVV